MAQVAVVAAAASALLGGVSAFSAGQYQSAIAKRNAQIATQNAGAASDAAQAQAQESDREGAALLGSQLADQGASGLSGNSQYYLRRQTQDTFHRDRENIALQGTVQSRGYLQEAANQKAAASQARTQAWFALGKGVLDAGSSLVGRSSSIKNKIAGRLRNGG